MHRTPTGLALSCFAFLALVPRVAEAATKEECLEAHGRGQDLREKSQLVAAKRAFMTCAQSGCPNMVQADCARFADEVDRLIPTVAFSARDQRGTDVPSTLVYVDDLVVATRLEDGHLRELDPGPHTVRFVHDGHERTLSVVLNQGEKARLVVATFTDSRATPTATSAAAPSATAEAPSRPLGPLALSGIGLAAAAVGGTLIGIGFALMPSQCSVSARDCAAPPGDPAFAKAQSSMTFVNVGTGLAIGGVVTFVAGLVWYFAQPKSVRAPESAGLPIIRF